MEFIAVAVDGGEAEIEQFLIDTGATNLTNVSEWTNPSALNAYLSAHRPTGIPTVVYINQDGEVRSNAGWSRGAAEDNLDWLAAN